VVADRPNKANPIRVRVTVGGDRIDYPEEVSTKTSDLATVKLLLNSTISTDNANWMSLDIKDFYLNTPMTLYEYMKVPLALFPAAIIQHYNLEALEHNGFIYTEIMKGMYGLPQAGRLANNELIAHLQQHGYHQSKFTPGLFHHDTRPIAFCLVVDDFGIRYVGKENAEHLIDTLKAKYSITIDWAGTKFVGLNLDWDYRNRTVDISMPTYIPNALARFQHPTPTKPQHSPHAWTKPTYGATQQMTSDPDTSPRLNPKEVNRLQQIIGVLLYYARAVDSSMLVALGSLASAQSKATINTMKAANQLLDYAATHPDAKVRYHPSDMVLHVHSDASYLSETEARSRAGGISFLAGPELTKNINGAVHIHSSIMKNVLSSATEAEVGALYHNAHDACTLRQALKDMGHPQPATPMQTDNACAHGILNDTVKQKRSKAMDMRYYWLRDRVRQQQFYVHWEPGDDNQADYFTKHHPVTHHRQKRPVYFHTENPAQGHRGCVEIVSSTNKNEIQNV
jgi:Reverse transcriptase (RNA-dependent DNA polymerase)